MTIGEAAKKSGLTISAIRYYERKGILKTPDRISKNRIYTEADINCLLYLKTLKQIGMPLSEIREYFELKKKENDSTEELYEILMDHKLYVEMKIEEYQEIIKDIEKRIENIDEKCEGEIWENY